MNTEIEHHTITERVTANIRAGKVHMRSRWRFVYVSIAFAVLAVSVFFVSSLILNFILFSIHTNSHEALLGFGQRGWVTFFHVFPWSLFFIDVGLIMLLVWLLRTFRLGYRIPILYLGIALLIVVSVAGIVVERYTPTNDFFVREITRPGILSPIPRFFGDMGMLPRGNASVCRCEIVEVVHDGELRVRDIHTGESYTAYIENAPYASTTGLSEGMRVFIGGDIDGDIITVFGMKLMHERKQHRMMVSPLR